MVIMGEIFSMFHVHTWSNLSKCKWKFNAIKRYHNRLANYAKGKMPLRISNASPSSENRSKTKKISRKTNGRKSDLNAINIWIKMNKQTNVWIEKWWQFFYFFDVDNEMYFDNLIKVLFNAKIVRKAFQREHNGTAKTSSSSSSSTHENKAAFIIFDLQLI